MNVLVLAFDGVIADTITARATALVETLATHDIEARAADVVAALPGRTLHEALRDVLHARLADGLDETLLDVMTMQAQQRCAQRMLQGVAIAPALTDVVRQLQVHGTAVVVRSDSLRREVEPTLALTGVLGEFRMVRCADDPSRVRGTTSLERSYAEILRRTARGGEYAAFEVGDYAGAVARRVIGKVTPVAVHPWSGERVLEGLLRTRRFRG